MTKEELKKAALLHFATQGYEGASLAQIARDAKIQKPSIYAHFKSKADLFSAVLEDVLEDERKFVSHYLSSHKKKPVKERLLGLLIAFQQRYDSSNHTKFWLRMTFFPPEVHHEQIISNLYAYLDEIEEQLIQIFQKEMPEIPPQKAAISFMCLLDGLLAEILYGGKERFIKRLGPSWETYWNGIQRLNLK